jgi:hypothetical protein
MNERFQALTIYPASAGVAYPLVRLHDAGITLKKWLVFARRRCSASGRSGLIAIRDCRGIIHAVFSYRNDIDLRVRRRLCISDLIVAHLPGSGIERRRSCQHRPDRGPTRLPDHHHRAIIFATDRYLAGLSDRAAIAKLAAISGQSAAAVIPAMATTTLKRDIIVILAIKITIVLISALFVFGPHQRPHINVDAVSLQILNSSMDSSQEP